MRVAAREDLLIDSYRKTAGCSSFIPGRLSGYSDWTLDVRNVRNEFAPFARIFARSSIPGTSARRCKLHRGYVEVRALPFSFPLSFSLSFSLCLSSTSAVAIDSAPVSGKRLHSLDQYLQRDSEFRLHAPSDLAGVSRTRP